MPPPAQQPSEPAEPRERPVAAAHRRQILAAARQLFAEQGVEATSMHEIARAAGVGQGTLYRRFAHKGALCLALLTERTAAFSADTEAALAAADGPALEQLAMLLERLAAFNEEHGPLLGAITAAAAGPRRAEAYTNPFYSWLRATVGALLERAVARGEAAPLDVACASDLLLAPLAVDLYLHQRQGLGLSQERILATLRRLLVRGLRG